MEERNKETGEFRRLLTGILIWSLIIPLVFLDVCTEIYHRIGFRLCKIPLVKRSNYIKIDRYKLKYLTFAEKIGCAYCGYANGLCAYISEIAARSEKYWCAIKHKKYHGFIEPKHHKDFLEYGDKKAFEKKYR